jgi:hypothetical protein
MLWSLSSHLRRTSHESGAIVMGLGPMEVVILLVIPVMILAMIGFGVLIWLGIRVALAYLGTKRCGGAG